MHLCESKVLFVGFQFVYQSYLKRLNIALCEYSAGCTNILLFSLISFIIDYLLLGTVTFFFFKVFSTSGL